MCEFERRLPHSGVLLAIRSQWQGLHLSAMTSNENTRRIYNSIVSTSNYPLGALPNDHARSGEPLATNRFVRARLRPGDYGYERAYGRLKAMTYPSRRAVVFATARGRGHRRDGRCRRTGPEGLLLIVVDGQCPSEFKSLPRLGTMITEIAEYDGPRSDWPRALCFRSGRCSPDGMRRKPNSLSVREDDYTYDHLRNLAKHPKQSSRATPSARWQFLLMHDRRCSRPRITDDDLRATKEKRPPGRHGPRPGPTSVDSYG